MTSAREKLEDPRGPDVKVPGLGRWSLGGSSSSFFPHAHPHHVKEKDDTRLDDGHQKAHQEEDPSARSRQVKEDESPRSGSEEHRHKGILERLGMEAVEGGIWRIATDPITGSKVAVRDQVSHHGALKKLGLEGEDRTGLRKSDDEAAFRSSSDGENLQPLGPELTSWATRDEQHGLDSKGSEGSQTAHLHLFPPLDWHKHHFVVHSQYIKMAATILLGMVLVSVFPKTIYFILPLSILSLIYTKSIADRHLQNVKWDTDRQRGQKFAVHQSIPESVEWLNAVLEKIWPLINSDIFVPIVDLLEDAMQSQIPAIVHGVQIADMSQGKNPIRVSFLRTLPDNKDSDHDKAKRKDVNENSKEGSQKYINLELAFVYQARPRPIGHKAVTQDENMRLVVYLYIGLKALLSIRVPVWVEMVGVTGTARARLELLPDPPFIGQATVSLMGLPKIEISATPLMKGVINVMNLPLISRYVLSCMNAVAAAFVAPGSVSINLAQALVGDDVKKDCDALGILVVVIHSGTDLMASDTNSKSDPYVTLAFEQFGKLLYSTKIILGDLEPVWEETAFVLVNADAVSAGERICCTVWDSDRLTADDVLGLASVSLQDLVRQQGKIQIRDDQLEAFGKRGEKGQGRLRWSVGYFPKDSFFDLNRPVKKDDTIKNPRLPKDLQDYPGLQKKKSRIDTLLTSSQEQQVHTYGAKPDHPLGIVSIQIHQISDLEVIKTSGTLGKRQDGFEDADVGNVDEEGEALPSSYCSIILNGEKIYKTRIKPANSRPFFNTGTERVIRDWQSCSIMIVVRDSRLREEDPILGVVRLDLADYLHSVSQTTDWYPLKGGIGHGRIRISLLFRSAGPQLPQSLTGWQIGVLQLGAKLTARDLKLPIDDYKHLAIHVQCAGQSKDFSSHQHQVQEGGENVWRNGKIMQFPVRRRYTSAITLTFTKKGALPIQSKPLAKAVLFLKFLRDYERMTVTIPVWKTEEWERLNANCFERAPFGEQDRNHQAFNPLPYSDDRSADFNVITNDTITRLGLQQVGTLTFQLRFEPGISEVHYDLTKSDQIFADAYEGWKCELLSHRKQSPPATDRHEDGETQQTHAGAPSESSQPGENEDLSFDDQDVEDTYSDDSSWASLSSEYRQSLDAKEGSEHSIKGKWKTWKENQRNLHRHHRGVMQSKKVRSIAWVGQNARHAASTIGDTFSMHERQPEVETEV